MSDPAAVPAPALRPRRSALYLPASNARAVDKARGLPCDVVILDLEDAVAPEQKAQARDGAVAAVAQGGFGAREVVVRVNGLDTPWGEEDLRACLRAPPHAVLVPKVSDAGDLARYDGRLSHAPAGLALWAMVETARALFHLEPLAAAARDTRLAGLVMGTNDLAKEIGWSLAEGRAPFLPALAMAVAAARAHGVLILDGVFNRFEDEAGLAAECRQGAAFGFDGKTLIHPNQIPAANAAFSPSAEAVAYARAVVAAFLAPENAGKGAVRLEGGRMAERMHLAQAHKTLAAAAAVAAD